ncbi:MAG: HU family DNA-binding protein [Candidatus Magasanikbacteria bacterium]|uniref:DNA-binding protein n=1 Tax=Candidatus Doudnabacteria bacterium CG10_big_fil_rev_8_21_14_0_10_41_10 TaxID=1974551 RepID=A0A2H0VD33_9BACT|nr:HU family DNA-binding protein [Candidatus Magasanikbacteria bacterium]PIR97034.1 MAG: hypothetical protein COT91_03505 [Candidatus Doudnabacteria bacterium CG10_big_fil_rev_8_21_14_0_10_41_10]
MKLNKALLAQAIADKAGVSKKEAEDMVAAFVDVVTKALMDGGEVTIAGFGAFSAKVRAGRIGVNPQNPAEKIQIPPVTVPKFKAGKALKDALKGKRNVGQQPPPTQQTTSESTTPHFEM